VCKHFLVKFCPNDLFVNTKADLGVCPKIHDERLKKEYEKSSRFEKMGYEEDFLRFCQSMLSDVEKRIRRARARLALSNKESNPSQVKNNDEKINVLTERINGLLVQVENLGCEGKVEEAQGIMKLCEQLEEERAALKKASEANHWYQALSTVPRETNLVVLLKHLKSGCAFIMNKQKRESREREKLRDRERKAGIDHRGQESSRREEGGEMIAGDI
ncbi:Luc7-like protein 3, partial [Araneus ventricosus]